MRLQPLHVLPLLLIAQLSLGGLSAEAKSSRRHRKPASAPAAAVATENSAAAQETPSQAVAEAESAGSVIQFERAENSTLHFKLPKDLPKELRAQSVVKTELYDLSPVGTIAQASSFRPKDSGLPYFIFTARPCSDCIQDRHVYLIRPAQEKPVQMIQPGKILDSKSRELLLDSRAFFGHCLRNAPGDVYVVFQKERVDRKHKLQNSVYVAEPTAERLHEKLLERNLPRLEHTLQAVRSKQCQEIDGRYRLMVKRPLDLRSRAKRTADEAADSKDAKDSRDEEEDDDTPTKENQTDSELPSNAD